ncbi:hypothetical protein OIU84_007818 [Salix udensis]|uniref:Protein argonaute N-terminal domain-containing protein n=1 Tax=Salix udensis TaxID=889485 RepID=A0AAD6JTP5_9ROSI|nr:hypothetical protein OIU84_007818 [Salix udensis]
MVRKRRTELPQSGGESSESQETGAGRGAHPPDERNSPPQQGGGGGGYQGGRGYSPQSQQGGRGGGYGGGRGRGGMQQQHFGGAPEYQVRGRGQPQQGGRGSGRGGGGRGGPPSGGPFRTPAPELHQATPAPYPAGVTPQPMISEASSSMQPPEPSPTTVSIIPEVQSRVVNRAVMEQLVKLYRESHLGKRLPAYDGRKSLYTAGALPFQAKEFKITLVDEDDGTGGQRKDREFKVVIKFAARADLHHLGLFLQGKQADAPQEALQVLDIVLRELPTSRWYSVSYFTNLCNISFAC